VPIRVLVVDDHTSLRQLFDLCLSFEDDLELVGTASDGRQAVQLAAELRPDAVVLDSHLPDGDGIDLLPTLLQTVPEATVVMFSAWGDTASQAQAMHRGARSFLVKDRDSVTDVIAELRSAGQGGPPRSASATHAA
jgi:DNA-binding NarL/FixJ family response regulator